MLDKTNKLLTITFVFAFILSASLFAQEKEDSTMNHKNMNMHNMEMMKDHKMNMMCDSTHQKMHDEMNCTDTVICEKMKANMDHSKVMDHKDMDHKMMNMKNMDRKMMDHSMMMDSTGPKMSEKEDSIVRKGVIDLKSIDKNKDGKVFQDMMDYNVISDKAGKCPLCGMKLKEVSLKKAKDTLLKNGYKVK